MSLRRAMRIAVAATAVVVALSPAAHAKDGAVPAPLWRAYVAAIEDSAIARPNEVVTDLLVPAPGAPRTQWKSFGGEDYVLVSTMRHSALSDVAADQPFTLGADRWIAIPGELSHECVVSRCARMSPARLDLRLKELLGLPPDANYATVTRFWVRASDMFRPCTDPRVTSSTCPAEVPAGLPDQVAGIDPLPFLWRQANYAWRLPSRANPSSAISCSADFTNSTGGKCIGFPWTRLGYTYDWAPEAADRRGVTEFVVPKGTTVYMESTGPQRDYYPHARSGG